MIDRTTHINRIDNLINAMIGANVLDSFYNGVGSTHPLLKWFRPPQWIQKLFDDAAIFHDVAYWVGGSSEHQEIVDEEFGARCWHAVSKLGFLKRKLALLWLNIDDDALKNFGFIAFEARTEPLYSLGALLMEAGRKC